MYDLKRRLNRLEIKTSLFGKRFIIWLIYKTPLLPDVFDKPLDEWKTCRRDSNITVDPYREAVERGGEIPFVLAEKYDLWRTEQMKLFKAVHAEIILYSHPDKARIEQNCTNTDRD